VPPKSATSPVPLPQPNPPVIDLDNEDDAVPAADGDRNISVDPDNGFEIKYNCNQIRTRINTFINNGGMKVGELQIKLKVSPQSYQSFMRQSGPHAGVNNNTYSSAHQFFVQREAKGLKMPRAKKATKEDEAKYAVDDTTPDLPGEPEGKVPIYDTCHAIRKKIDAHLRKPGVTQAALARELSKCIPGAETIGSKNITDFQRKKGIMAGNTTKAYYAAYVYFEKMRIKEKKPKSKKRNEMEAQHGNKGVDTEFILGPSTKLWMGPDEDFGMNEYGQLEITSAGGRTRVLR